MFSIQVLIHTATGSQWKAVRPTRGEPYKFLTRDDAEKMVRVCYPFPTAGTVRIVEVTE